MAVCDADGDLCRALNNHLRDHGKQDTRMADDIRHLGESVERIEGGLKAVGEKIDGLAPAAKRGRDAWDLILRALVAVAALVAAYVFATSVGQQTTPVAPTLPPVIVVPAQPGAPAAPGGPP